VRMPFVATREACALAITLTALLAAGCTTAGPANPHFPKDRCRASAAGFAVGAVYDIHLGERARRAAGAISVRVVGPDDIVTTGYKMGRLTVIVDASGRVSKLSCG
jgi:hypothetical protein